MPVHAAAQLLTPDNCMLTLIDHQPTTTLDVTSIDATALVNNTAGLAEGAAIFGLPVVLATILARSGGPIFPEIAAAFPHHRPVDRSNTNAFEDDAFVSAVEATGRRKIVVAGLWTDVCVSFTVLSAIEAGYEVYVVADACGSTSAEAHERAMTRMTAAGAVPVTWMTVLSELLRDWSRTQYLQAVTSVAVARGGITAQKFRFQQAIAPDLYGPPPGSNGTAAAHTVQAGTP